MQETVLNGSAGGVGGWGAVYVDAVMSGGAFEVAAGSHVVVEGVSLLVASVRRYEGAWGRVHHWELEVR